jgi:hypothetical protein
MILSRLPHGPSNLYFLALASAALFSIANAQDARQWTKKMGHTMELEGKTSSALDAEGNLYVTGVFYQPNDFDPGPGEYMMMPANGKDLFICKLSAAGDFLWAIHRECHNTWAGSISVDREQNLAVTGLDQQGLYIGKFTGTGALVWEHSLKGIFISPRITADAENNVVVSGLFRECEDFDPGAGISVPDHAPDQYNFYPFIVKFNKLGEFEWSQIPGGLTRHPTPPVACAGEEIFTVLHSPPGCELRKLRSNGATIWSISLKGNVMIPDLRIDSEGNVVMAGNIYETLTIESDGEQHTLEKKPLPLVLNGNGLLDSDVFILKLDQNGRFKWARQFGGVSYDALCSMDLGTDDRIYIAGSFRSQTDFDPGSTTYRLFTPKEHDGYFSVFDKDGTFLCANRVNGSEAPAPTYANAVHVDRGSNIYNIERGQFGIFHISKTPVCTYAPYVPPQVKIELDVRPNPVTSGILEMRTDTVQQFRLFDALGKTLIQGETVYGVTYLDLKSFIGICYLELYTTDGHLVKKVVVK